jgi:hypothetical protein
MPCAHTTSQSRWVCTREVASPLLDLLPPTYIYFSLNKDYKTHLIYLGKKRINLARQYSANYHKLLEIVEEMTVINMALLKESESN